MAIPEGRSWTSAFPPQPHTDCSPRHHLSSRWFGFLHAVQFPQCLCFHFVYFKKVLLLSSCLCSHRPLPCHKAEVQCMGLSQTHLIVWPQMLDWNPQRAARLSIRDVTVLLLSLHILYSHCNQNDLLKIQAHLITEVEDSIRSMQLVPVALLFRCIHGAMDSL